MFIMVFFHYVFLNTNYQIFESHHRYTTKKIPLKTREEGGVVTPRPSKVDQIPILDCLLG